jgi:hypothetical protein
MKTHRGTSSRRVGARAVIVGSLGGASLVLLAPLAALACSMPRPAPVDLTGPSVPSDGLVAGVINTCAACTARDIHVYDDAGGDVPGSVQKLPELLAAPGWFAFRPTTRLTVL